MKKYLIFSFILFSIILTGCNVKGEYDIKGTVMEVERSSILVEDAKLGLIWLSLPEGSDSKNFEKGQSVAVWTDGKIRESYPLQGTALNIEVIK
jgi:predicted small secreted protein